MELGWERGSFDLKPYSEVVMTPGMRITGTNPNGTVTITAGEATRRTYSGTGWQKSRKLIARRGRWYGSLGLYDPAASFSPYGRLLVEEGQRHFHSVAEAMRWLHEYQYNAYTNNGLVFDYRLSAPPPPDTGEPARDVYLWQIYINGRRPKHLPGANDNAIRVEGGSIPNTATPHPDPQ